MATCHMANGQAAAWTDTIRQIVRLSLFTFDAVDHILCDIIYTNKLSGSIALVVGDFRQILPVIFLGSRPDIVDAVLSRSATHHSTDSMWRIFRQCPVHPTDPTVTNRRWFAVYAKPIAVSRASSVCHDD